MAKIKRGWKKDFWKKGPRFSKTFPKRDVIFKRIKRPKGFRILDVTKIPGKGVAVSFVKTHAPKFRKRRR